MNKVWRNAIVVIGLVLTLRGASSWEDTKPTINDFSDGRRNTAGGTGALQSNTDGSLNTAFGYSALEKNTSGSQNTASSVEALKSNTTGYNNTATGAFALYANTTGGGNTATGRTALASNTTGSVNTATGRDALANNTSGSFNTGNGYETLLKNTIGAYNTALGFRALSNSTGSRNLALGLNAGFNLTSGDNNIYLGHTGFATESNTLRLGQVQVQTRAFMAGITGVAVSGSTVVINSSGQLSVPVSSARYKRDIHEMGARSRGLHQLRPVTFRYKHDAQGQRQYGLIAEEVAKVYPKLVTKGADGKVESAQYHELIPMLLNEVQHLVFSAELSDLTDS